MYKMKREDLIYKLMGSILIVFLSYTFMNKVLIFDSFIINIARTGMFSGWHVYAIAIVALIMELSSILLLVFTKKIGYAFTSFMLMVFSCYIIILYSTNRYESCGCGGIMNGLPFLPHLIINILLISLSITGWHQRQKNESN